MASVSRSRYLTLAILLAASLLANLFLSVRLFHFRRPPFSMMMTPAADGGAIVQFVQPLDWNGKMAVSSEFHVDVELAKPFVESLTSARVKIPGAVVELGDVTIYPGAFYLRFGDEAMSVMESRVEWRGKSYYWAEDREEAGKVERE